MDFYSGQDLLDLCQKEKISISSAMKQREITMGSLSAEEIQAKLETVLAIMKDSVHKPLKEPVRSIGGLLGGEAKKVADHSSSPNSVCVLCYQKQLLTVWLFLKSMLPWD